MVVVELLQIVLPHNKALKLRYHIQKKVWLLYLSICHSPSVWSVCVCSSLLLHTLILFHTESGKVQEVYGVLMPLNLWLSEQQHKLDAMRPAAVLTAPLIDQITETDVRTLLVRILAI